MKLISTSLGKIIVACAAALIILGFVATLLIPSIQDFGSKVFPSEKNYIIKAENSENLILTCAEDVFEMLVDDEVDIFENITAKSSDNENLIAQLTEDYQKPLAQRDQVFVYKRNEDGTTTLCSEIDTSSVGEWVVLYVLKRDSERTVLKVNYVFL